MSENALVPVSTPLITYLYPPEPPEAVAVTPVAVLRSTGFGEMLHVTVSAGAEGGVTVKVNGTVLVWPWAVTAAISEYEPVGVPAAAVTFADR